VPLLLGWRSAARGQSLEQRDTHSVAAANFLLEECDGWELCDSGSVGSLWCPAHREGTRRELAEPQTTSSLSSGSGARELHAGAGAPVPSWGAVCPPRAAPTASPPLTPAACPATAPSVPGSCSKRGEAASGPGCLQPVGRALPRGQGHRGRTRAAVSGLTQKWQHRRRCARRG